jgi:hypothetical protein
MNLKPAILGEFDALANNYATQVSSAIQAITAKYPAKCATSGREVPSHRQAHSLDAN